MFGALLIQRPIINGVDIDLFSLHVKLELELADIDMIIVLAKQQNWEISNDYKE